MVVVVVVVGGATPVAVSGAAAGGAGAVLRFGAGSRLIRCFGPVGRGRFGFGRGTWAGRS